MTLLGIEKTLNKKSVLYIILLLIIVLGAITATINSSITDDAYISFRYAKNFIQGNGLVSNNGEYVEGYSNLLWLLVTAGFMRFGFEPVVVSKVLGILFFAFNILVVYNISKFIFGKSNHKQIISLLVTLAFTTNLSAIYFATGGLEHSMFIFLLLVSSCLLFIAKRPAYANLVFLLLILTRNEGLLFFVLANAIFYFYAKKEKKVMNELIFSVIATILMLSVYEMWRFAYYNSLLPNVFYVKATTTAISEGVNYLAGYFASYPLLIFLLPFIFYSLFIGNGIIKYYSISSIFYLAYLIKIGGDFMAYRFATQVLVFLLISGSFGFVAFLKKFGKNKKVNAILISTAILLGAVPIYRGEVYSDVSLDAKILNIEKHSNWEYAGKKLNEEMPKNARVAITAAGAIPYHSELYTLDMLGLNDANISRQEPINGERPGHKKQATFNYLVDKKINFVIGHPETIMCENACKEGQIKHLWFLPKEVMEQQLVFLKLNNAECFRMFYLTKTEEINNYLKDNKNFIICEEEG